MNKQIEHLLLSVLACLSVLLGLTFWLNIQFGFNLFSSQHWQELSSLQASNAPIAKSFYISMVVAVFILVFCLYMINRPHFTNHKKNIAPKPVVNIPQKQPVIKKVEKVVEKPVEQKTVQNENPPIATPNPTPINQEPIAMPQIQEPETKTENTLNDMFLAPPPKLNLPKNIEQLAARQYEQMKSQPNTTPTAPVVPTAPAVDPKIEEYSKEIAETFSNCAYLVKPNPTIAGLKTNLFAIGNKEVVWLGCINCDINKLKTAIEKLKTTFKETLEDIPITVYSFLLDTDNRYDSDENVFVFHNIDDLKKFILENQGLDIPDSDQEDFNAYSEYIDTIINLVYKG